MRRIHLNQSGFCFAAVAVLLATGNGRTLGTATPQAKSAASSDQSVYTLSDNVNLVLLDVSVKDSRGGYVTGLTQKDFQVFEEGRAQEITQFGTLDTPVTVGLIVDNSGSMRLKRPHVVLAGLAFAKESNPEDEFFVVNFNDRVVRGLPDRIAFTDSLQRLRAALYYGEPKGQTALYDAVAYSLQHLELSHQDKRTLIVVSDGGDNVSRISLSELITLIEASRATIYTIGLFDPEDRDRNPNVLRKLAKLGGGEYFEPARLQDVVPVFHKISTDIRNRYSIGYVPPDLEVRRVLRSVHVTAAAKNHRKLIVRTRTAYTVTPFSELITQQNEARRKKK
ncbi:MAG: VWA domain-containing protein [Bryobacteraceae bacterium]